MAEALVVTPAEAGQKLLQFLTRRFDAPQSVLHRWIRSGQVRINGGRAKPFDRVEQGNEIRIPPFAVRSTGDSRASDPSEGTSHRSSENAKKLPLPPIVSETVDVLVFCKPSGLAVHPGTGHEDSLTTRLAVHYRNADFMPAPVHRLDRDTSGLLLVAKSYTALRQLADAFARHDGTVSKEYLLWVRGDCPWSTPTCLEDRLAKQTDATGYEKVGTTGIIRHSEKAQLRRQIVSSSGVATEKGTEKGTDTGKDASLTALCIRRMKGWSLLLVRLHTGRTHQIRVQLASRGFPLAGDVKYGGPRCEGGLKLHAARLMTEGNVYEALPPWTGEWNVSELPPPLS